MRRSMIRSWPARSLVVGFFSLGAATLVWAQEMPSGPVRYTEAREHMVRGSIVLPGSVESRTVSLVASEVEGLVVELSAREGDEVKKGQPLARLRKTSMGLRRDAAAAQLKEAEARLKLAERSLERARELFESKVMSQQQLDDAFYEYTAWEGRVEQLTAEIASIDHDLERCIIRAPFTGAVVAEHAEMGEWVAVGEPIIEMVSLVDLEVRVEVPERYFHSLQPGSEANVTFESLPGTELTGRIKSIIPRADPQARTFPLKIGLQHTNGRVGAGMLAQVSMAAGESRSAIIVPKDAIVGEAPDQHLFVINGDGTVKQVPVETGEALGAWVAISGEVMPGDKVVTRGNERLRQDQSVEGEPLEYELP